VYSRADGAVQVWFATAADADPAFLDWLDERERRRYQRFSIDADRARYLVGTALLRSAVARLQEKAPEQVELDRTCAGCGRWHGPPRVLGSRIAASVAHSRLLVGVAVAASGRVGLDIERLDRGPRVMTSAWVRREARFKAGGGRLDYRELPTPLAGYLAGAAADFLAGPIIPRPREGTDLLHGSPGRTARPAG
jgi:4'-phosphopantetheinyl transferase